MSLPVSIKGARPDLSDDQSSSVAETPDLRVLRAQYATTPALPNIPPRVGTPGQTTPHVVGTPTQLPVDLTSARSGANAGGGSAQGPAVPANDGAEVLPLDLEGFPDEEMAKVLARHLVLKDERSRVELTRKMSIASSSRSSEPSSNAPRDAGKGKDPEPFPIPYDTPGADITHDVYKWHADQQRHAGRTRAVSFAGLPQQPDPAFEHIHEPGGFRRNYVKLRANEQGTEEPQMLNNFIEFLLLFGHFAGEDLDEEDDDEKPDNESPVAGPSGTSGPSESTPLLKGGSGSKVSRSRSRSRQRRGSAGPHHGNATVTQAVLMLLKSFIGTGVLFLGKAFCNGGILFSAVLFTIIAMISLYSFILLIKAKFVVPGSFGEIGGELYGPWLRYTILGSIIISQLGFVAAYTIFVAENLQAFFAAVTDCMKLAPVQYYILAQLVVFLPLALIRDLAKLSTAALIADAFILVGLCYIFGSEMAILAERGVAKVRLFNPKDFSLFVGTAVYSFEGIGLIVPITDAMREPHKFPQALTGVMFFLTLLFGGSGALAYLTFGSDIQAVVFVNLDPSKKMVLIVQFIYSLAILLSVPLQLFPAVRILENGLFTRSGKSDNRVKWMKNCFRFFMVMICTFISIWGAQDLDKFVAFVGCFACVPLCYVYPAMLHYKACARTKKQKLADIMMIVFGILCSIYTTIQTVKLMVQAPEPAGNF